MCSEPHKFLFCFYQTWYGDIASLARVSCGKKIVCYLQGQSHNNKGSYDQNMSLSTVSSELLIPWQPNLLWWYIIISQSVSWKKIKKYCYQGQGHSEGSVCQCLSRWYLVNRQTFCYQTWYCGAPSWARVSCRKIALLFSKRLGCYFQKDWVAIFKKIGLLFSKRLCCYFQKDWVAIFKKIGLLFSKRLGCYFQGQDHSEGSKLYWIFMYRILSVALISLEVN